MLSGSMARALLIMNGPIKLLIVTGVIGVAASAMVARLEATKTQPQTQAQTQARQAGAPSSAQTAQQSAQQSAQSPASRAQRPPIPGQTGAPKPTAQPAAGVRVAILADSHGQFSADVEIDGRRLKMLVDTGATFVSLSHDDAAGVGLRPQPHEFTMPLLTASGELKAARARLREVRVNGIVAYDVPAIVMPKGAGPASLLGMSFLSKLRGFEVASGQLVLKP